MEDKDINMVYVIHNAVTGDLYFGAYLKNKDEANELACKFNNIYQNNKLQKSVNWNVLALPIKDM